MWGQKESSHYQASQNLETYVIDRLTFWWLIAWMWRSQDADWMFQWQILPRLGISMIGKDWQVFALTVLPSLNQTYQACIIPATQLHVLFLNFMNIWYLICTVGHNCPDNRVRINQGGLQQTENTHSTLGLKTLSLIGLSETPLLRPVMRSVSCCISCRMSSKSVKRFPVNQRTVSNVSSSYTNSSFPVTRADPTLLSMLCLPLTWNVQKLSPLLLWTIIALFHLHKQLEPQFICFLQGSLSSGKIKVWKFYQLQDKRSPRANFWTPW